MLMMIMKAVMAVSAILIFFVSLQSHHALCSHEALCCPTPRAMNRVSRYSTTAGVDG